MNRRLLFFRSLLFHILHHLLLNGALSVWLEGEK